MLIIGIDPGPTESAYCILKDGIIQFFCKDKNEEIASWVDHELLCGDADVVAVEHLQSFGMPVGKEVFETAYFIGEIRSLVKQEGGRPTFLPVYRKEIVTHHCNNPRAKDANVRQAMLDRWGPQGTKKNPGPTYGISKDVWSALAIATYAMDKLKDEEKEK